MSEQIKTDFARAQKFIKAEQYSQAITILQPHKEHARIAALIADLEAKRKPRGGIWITAIWITVVIIVAVIAGVVGYGTGDHHARSEQEIPSEYESVFVDVCTAGSDVPASTCIDLIQGDWLLYRKETNDCYNLAIDTPNFTDAQFLDCILAVGE